MGSTPPRPPLDPPAGAAAHLHDVAAPGAPERLNGEKLPLLHAGGVAALDDGDVLTRVDLVGADAVAVEVAHALDRVGGAVDLDLVALHHFLNRRSDLPPSPRATTAAAARIGKTKTDVRTKFGKSSHVRQKLKSTPHTV